MNQINLALLVTKDGVIQLMHQTYGGNFYGNTAGEIPVVPMENGAEALGAERTVVVTYEQKLYNRNLKNEKLKSFGKMILFTNNHENTKNFIYCLFRMDIYGNY